MNKVRCISMAIVVFLIAGCNKKEDCRPKGKVDSGPTPPPEYALSHDHNAGLTHEGTTSTPDAKQYYVYYLYTRDSLLSVDSLSYKVMSSDGSRGIQLEYSDFTMTTQVKAVRRNGIDYYYGYFTTFISRKPLPDYYGFTLQDVGQFSVNATVQTTKEHYSIPRVKRDAHTMLPAIWQQGLIAPREGIHSLFLYSTKLRCHLHYSTISFCIINKHICSGKRTFHRYPAAANNILNNTQNS